jgi:HTH-type transcriptional regulator, quorum sensing regulator NprR
MGKVGGHMEFGSLIKYYRTQRGITQKELAAGICSIPHLSKIENNSKEANEETLSLLLSRLSINLEEAEEQEVQIAHLIKELEGKINFYLREEAEEIYLKLKEIEHIIPYSESIYLYELIKFRFLLFKGLLEEAEKQKELLAKQKKNFSQHEGYLFLYYQAVSLIINGQYVKADELLDTLGNEKNEMIIGDFLYHRALVKSSLEQSGHAIHFGKIALQIFMNEHNFIRILHVLILLGINYTHAKIYEEALECFNHLIRNAELLKEDRLLPQIYHNMGYLQDKMKNPKQALVYFEKSLALQPYNQHYLVTLFAMGKINYTLESIDDAKESFLSLRALAKQMSNKKYRLLADFYLLHIDSLDKSIEFLEAKVIPYFIERNEHNDDLMEFYKMLSNYYNQREMYPLAFKYLNKVL